MNGQAEVVNGICDHPDIVAVSFVGSSRIAEHVAKRCRALNKRVLALGGAKNHLVRGLSWRAGCCALCSDVWSCAIDSRATVLQRRVLIAYPCVFGVCLQVSLPDCDVAMASHDIVASFSGCCGQRCMAAAVLLTVGEQDELVSKIVEKAGALKAGTVRECGVFLLLVVA